MENQEYSESGDPIYRYENVTPKDFTPAFGDGENIEVISNHIEKHIGKIEYVFHEIISDLVHIDVHWIKPSKKFPFHTLVTSGMSDLPMSVPAGSEENQFAELCILLPNNWQIEGETSLLMEEVFKDEENYWPIRWLKTIARFPHIYNTWIGYGHTIPNGAEAEAYAPNTKLGCMITLPSISIGLDFFQLEINLDKTIKFYCLYPLYKEEMEYKLKKGSDALLEKFEKHNIIDVIDINRTNTCLKTGFLGLW
jgi:hypothetical protein